MKILMITPEFAPFAKTGGLGDMAASLSDALAAAGHDVHAFIPLHASIHPAPNWLPHPPPLAVHLSPRETLFARVWDTTTPAH
jgi:starch synthase